MARKLRVAVWYNLPSGGAMRALHMHAKGLTERGHHVEAWRPPLPSPDYLPLRDLVPEHEVPLHFLEAGTSYRSRIMAHLMRQTLLLRGMVRHSQACAAEIERGGFDVLFANTDRFFYAPFVGRYLKMPKALYLQEPNRFLYEPLPRLPWAALPKGAPLRRRLRDWLDIRAYRVQAREERENAASYDRLLVNSFYSRESMLRAYGLESQVCYLGVDTDAFRPLGVPRERFLLGLGALVPSKNVRLAVEAVGALPAPRPPLLWVGNLIDEPYLAGVQALAERICVEFVPKVMIPDEEIVELLNRATALIYCPRLEPFGLAAVEAGACGLPVVAVAEGGLRETVRPGINGLLVNHDPAAIAAAIQTLLDDPAAAQRLGETAVRHVREHWTVEAAVDRLESSLLELVS